MTSKKKILILGASSDIGIETVRLFLKKNYTVLAHYNKNKPHVYPKWLGRKDIHQSHRSRLIQKQPDLYRQVWSQEKDDLEYVWPLPN